MTSGYKAKLKSLIEQEAAKQGCGLRVFLGLESKAIGEGGDFLYADHSYFKRGWSNGYFRLTRNDVHQTKLVNRPDDRLKMFGVRAKPWRKRGKNIVVVANTSAQFDVLGAQRTWMYDTLNLIRLSTSRPVLVKHKDGRSFERFIEDAWAVVSWASVAAVEAALLGVPVFVSDRNPAYPINAGRIEDIDNPEYKERHDWLCSLSYACWHVSELERIKFNDYEYSCRNDLPQTGV